MIEWGLWTAKHRHQEVIRMKRDRRPRRGMMVQFD
jgi:hypothetical protein